MGVCCLCVVTNVGTPDSRCMVTDSWSGVGCDVVERDILPFGSGRMARARAVAVAVVAMVLLKSVGEGGS